MYLEERLQVLQQQNEDLKERIDKNVAVSRSDKFKRKYYCSLKRRHIDNIKIN